MKLKQIATSVALAAALGGMGGTAAQAANITVPAGDAALTGTFSGFGGFDWTGNGNALVSGFALPDINGATDAFSLTFWASAATVTDAALSSPPPLSLFGVNSDILGQDIEYTIVAKITEVGTCTALTNTGTANPCGAASFVLTSGTWEIYYDDTKDADQSAGTGFDNGTLILAGNFTAGQAAGSFNVTGPGSGSGVNTISGAVTFTNGAFISPTLIGTTVGTTLQLGDERTDGDLDNNNVTGVPNGGGTALATTCNALDASGATICFQADANQSFLEETQVPAPGSLALLGIGLLGLARVFGRQRRIG